MARGELVPTELVVAIMTERLERPDVKNRGCLLDNFPLTVEQAVAMQGKIVADLCLFLELPKERLLERARGRRVDPQTGAVYHLQLSPPPPEIVGRLEQRTDDTDMLIEARLASHERSIEAIAPHFSECSHRIDGDRAPAEVFASIAGLLDAHGWGATEEHPYIGSKAFGGPFSATAARRGGFFTVDVPPDEGDAVACFQRGPNFRRQGTVVDVVECESDGDDGLLTGMVGARVTVRCDGSGSGGPPEFDCWAEFLGPLNDMEYSSVWSAHKHPPAQHDIQGGF